MTTQDEDSTRSPFTRPGFVVATIAVVVVIMLGVVLGIVGLTGDAPEPPPAAETSPAPESPSPTPSLTRQSDQSVCGLAGVELDGTLAAAPETVWEYQGTTAYPTSPEMGPVEVTDDGVRYCFQHSPSGALFAAANGLVQATDTTSSTAWLEHFAADGPYREEIITTTDDGSSTDDVRLRIAGFRMLEYTGDSARIDIAVESFAQGTEITGSFVYDLVWQSGDWKLSTETPEPFSFASVPDLAGYISWGE